MNSGLIRILAKKNKAQLQKNNKILNYVKNKKLNLKINKLEPAKLTYRVQKVIPKLPKLIDLRKKFQPIYDQGDLGSCTANALASIVGYDIPTLFGSRLFLYYNERMIEGSINIDAGAYLSDGIITLKTYGLCKETSWPYDINKFTMKPPDTCYTEGLLHQALTVQNIPNTLSSMKTSLANNEPFVVGILVYSSFMTLNVALTGVVPMPKKTDKLLGGHAIVCVGYNDSKQQWIMRNSWGASWGDKGYFYLPYQYLTDSRLTSDLWVILKMEI